MYYRALFEKRSRKNAMSNENQMKMTIVKFRDGYSLLWCQ